MGLLRSVLASLGLRAKHIAHPDDSASKATDRLYERGLAILREALGDPTATFREGQWEAIAALVQRHARLLVVQRTGWGKSAVYLVATRLRRQDAPRLTLIISPLLSLMRDQVAMAERFGLCAETLNSTTYPRWPVIIEQALSGHLDVLLVSPERLARERFLQELLLPIRERIGLLVVDEAHCISRWGHDFRPDYRRIVQIVGQMRDDAAILATTATATPRVVTDIQEQLGRGIEIRRGSLARESLRLQCIHLPRQEQRLAWLAEHLPELPGSGIVYTLTIRDAQCVAAWLQSQGIAAHAYWGGLDPEERVRLEQCLLSNEIKALVATVALGMGFDKPDMGFVVHFQRPASIIDYYQQVGRAGRAIPTAYGILLTGDEDYEISDYFIRTAFPSPASLEQVLDVLSNSAHGESIQGIAQRANLAEREIEHILQLLAVERPPLVIESGGLWQRQKAPYRLDLAEIAQIQRLRRHEQAEMVGYVWSKDCLMATLQRALQDPYAAPCGRCANCLGRPLISPSYSPRLAEEAAHFLRTNEQRIIPRTSWPDNALLRYGWSGEIPLHLRAEEGRALCIWGDSGWGRLVADGKRVRGTFDDVLVDALARLILYRWRPEPHPTWVTCVPSRRHPRLVPHLAARLAQRLDMPFRPCLHKLRDTPPQKMMQNDYQQAKNLAGAFQVSSETVLPGAVLLVDDIVDSGWTLTVLAALLRQAGSGPVFPVTLAVASAAE